MDISFIVTIYNKKKSVVERCLKSIKKMNDLSHEIIVIDDGSDTGMKDCYYKLSQKYNAQYYYQSNQGVSSARNLGIKKANGKYIFFVDCDDIVLNSKIQKKHIVNDPELVIFNVIKEDKLSGAETIKEIQVPNNNKFVTSAELASNLIEDGLMNWVYGKLYSTSFLHSHEIKFNMSIKTGEDLDFVVKVVNNAVRIKYFPLSVYRYEFDPSTGNGRIEKDPIGAIRDINYVYQLRKKIIDEYHLKKHLASINVEQTLQTYFEFYCYCISKHLITKNIYKELSKKVNLVESTSTLSLSTKIKSKIVNKNMRNSAYFYYKIRKIYKNLG